jgi:hypothetical protein
MNMHKYIWTIVSLCRWLVSYELTYTHKWCLCIWFKSSAQVHMIYCMYMLMTYTICTNTYFVCLCRWLILYVLTYTYKWWMCKWFKSSAQVHMKHCMYMQMAYTICTNIYIHIRVSHFALNSSNLSVQKICHSNLWNYWFPEFSEFSCTI